MEYNCFSSHFFLVISVILMLVFSALLLVNEISLLCAFLCCLLAIVSIHRRYLQCWQILFLLYLTHTVCQRHLWDVRLYACSLVFCSLVHFKNDLDYLTRDSSSYLSFWWHFCSEVCFLVVFSFSWGILFSFFSSPHVWWCPLLTFLSISKFPFLRAVWFFLNLVVRFFPSCVVFCVSLLVWRIFLW